MGFQQDIQKILSYLPRPKKHQTLMFSATIPKILRSVMQDALKADDFVEIDCLNDKGTNDQTSIHVNQTYLVLESMDDYVTWLIEIVTRATKADDNYKF